MKKTVWGLTLKNKWMKQLTACTAVMLLALAMLATPVFAEIEQIEVSQDYDWTRLENENITLNVYNWGEYISGLELETFDVNKAFTELTGIKVNYTNFDTNENLYSKLRSGGAEYDVIIPSDYMVGKLIAEDMLEPLDFANIPNYAKIGDEYKNLDYDPTNAYSVPYTWGYVGIVYNTTMVEGEIDSWEALWDSTYSGNILMFDNSRDAFAIASKRLGLSLNPSTKEEIDQAATLLKEQRGVLQAYVMDQIFDKMEGAEAAVAPYYAGDAITMMEENEDLAFAVPKEGTNYFVDAMCIPAGSKNKEAAEMYINFMCETDVAVENTLAIGYSTPQIEAEAALPEEVKNNPVAYPDDAVLANTEVFSVLPDELNRYMDEVWSDVRSYEEGGINWMIPALLALAVVVIVVVLWRRSVKKKRDDY